MITDDKIQQLLDRKSYLEHALGNPGDMTNDEFVKLSREYAELEPVAEAGHSRPILDDGVDEQATASGLCDKHAGNE